MVLQYTKLSMSSVKLYARDTSGFSLSRDVETSYLIRFTLMHRDKRRK